MTQEKNTTNKLVLEKTKSYKRWVIYFEDGSFLNHRLDGHALEYNDGRKYWYKMGKLHRLDGPAVEYPDGRMEWFFEGLIHRIGGPAVTAPNGDTFWFENGLEHRIDGPAVDTKFKKKWIKFGKVYDTKWQFFESLTDEEKLTALFSEAFHNA